MYYHWVYFFLVTRHLATVLAQSSESSSSSIVWSSPAPGDRFGPGDTIIGKWQAQPQVVSPSFCLCEGGVNGCGATVWPEVKESAGSYLVSVTAPNVTSESAFYLQMKDDFGHVYSSPIFNLTPAPPDHVAQSQSHQAPLSSSSSSTTDAAPAAVAAASAPSTVPTSATTTSEPLVAAAHNAPPAAALAVPLSLAGAIILLAGGLALHHRRQLAAERKRAREKLVRSDDATVAAAVGFPIALDLGRAARRIEPEADVEKALYTRAPLSRRGLGFSASASAPPFLDHAPDPYCSHPRRHHEQVAVAPSCPYVPACAYREGLVPEQRQRTRHFLLPYLPSRLCSRHPSSSSSSSYCGGSTGNGNGGGGSVAGSPWRLSSSSSSRLSISRSRSRTRRKVPPPRVAPTWTSPAMTESAVTSVTSEVLPSYLPSPNFSSAADRIHPIGSNVEFENVPLSPPLPPPLHTREEAAEPDDLRMKELRGMYEAVARALGSTHGGSG